jgi:hypothetical protein
MADFPKIYETSFRFLLAKKYVKQTYRLLLAKNL